MGWTIRLGSRFLLLCSLGFEVQGLGAYSLRFQLECRGLCSVHKNHQKGAHFQPSPDYPAKVCLQ